LNNRAAGPFVWIIHKLVEPNLRRVSNRQVALVMKPQAGLAGASGFDRLVGMHTAANGERAPDAARRFRLHRSRRPNAGLGVRSGCLKCEQYRQRDRWHEIVVHGLLPLCVALSLFLNNKHLPVIGVCQEEIRYLFHALTGKPAHAVMRKPAVRNPLIVWDLTERRPRGSALQKSLAVRRRCWWRDRRGPSCGT